MSFYETKFEDLVLLRSDIIPFPHAFSTRLGGYSSGVFSSFNFAHREGEDERALEANRALFARSFGLDADAVCCASQVHSSTVFTLEKAPEEELSGDGFATKKRGLLLCVKTADCVPILLCDSENRVAAALHAGWRGSFSDIVGKGIESMIALGAEAGNIVAAIGPAICRDCFEVGDEVVAELEKSLGKEYVDEYCAVSGGRAHIDLKALNRGLLLRRGVDEARIDVCSDCTCEHPDRYFSHRRMGASRGVMVSGITVPRFRP